MIDVLIRYWETYDWLKRSLVMPHRLSWYIYLDVGNGSSHNQVNHTQLLNTTKTGGKYMNVNSLREYDTVARADNYFDEYRMLFSRRRGNDIVG